MRLLVYRLSKPLSLPSLYISYSSTIAPATLLISISFRLIAIPTILVLVYCFRHRVVCRYLRVL